MIFTIKHIINLFYRVSLRIPDNMKHRAFPYLWARLVYFHRTGSRINYSNPKNINEKMFWLERYWQDPRVVLFTDKLTARSYVKACGLECCLSRIYATYSNASIIDIDLLPDEYVLKCNHCGGGKNILFSNKANPLSQKDIDSNVCYWFQEKYGVDSAEYHYYYIKPYVYAEEYIKDENKLEIQVFCFNGKASSLLVRNDLGEGIGTFAASYSLNWERTFLRKTEKKEINIPKPKYLDQLISYAETLAKPFPQIRVDFYYTNDRIVFGEMTFSSCGNILSNYKDEVIKMWGESLKLPPRIHSKWSHQIYVTYNNLYGINLK